MKRKIGICVLSIVVVNAFAIFALIKLAIGVYISCEKVTPSSAIFRINNNSMQSYSSGRDYEIEYLRNNSWEPLEQKTEYVICFPDLVVINAFRSFEFEINFDAYYGTLAPGKYRIAKNITRVCDNQKMMLYFEFDITS